jgi:hypothetical protein
MSGRNKYKDLEDKKRKRSNDDGYGVVVFFGGILLFTALTLAIWALIEARHGYDPYCRSDCCKATHVHEHFDFSNRHTAENFCIDRSTLPDDSDCPFIYFPISYGSLDGADGTFEVDNGVLTVDSTPFTFTYPQPPNDGPALGGGLDHVKFLTYVSNRDGTFKAFPTRSTGSCADATELVIEANVTCQIDLAFDTFLYDDVDVIHVNEDYRLASCGFNTIAFQEFNNAVGKGAWQVADFLLANKAIFIVNERLPFGKPGFGGTLNDYAGFTQFTKVARRNPSDFHKLAIAFNAAKQTIRYLIDDEEVYKVTRPGYLPDRCEIAIYHGGEEENSFPEYVSVGFGTFTILDAFHWNDGSCEGRGLDPIAKLEATPNAYYNPYYSDYYGEPYVLDDSDFTYDGPTTEQRIWGQGADMGIDYLRVYNQKCSCGA